MVNVGHLCTVISLEVLCMLRFMQEPASHVGNPLCCCFYDGK